MFLCIFSLYWNIIFLQKKMSINDMKKKSIYHCNYDAIITHKQVVIDLN